MVVKQRIPIYQVIVDDIQQQITSGNFDYDNPICTEKSICEKYNTSRITAKHAINKLEERGLLYRKRGSGSFVVRPVLQAAPTQIFALVTPFSTTQGGVFRAVESASKIFTKMGHQLTIHISQADTKGNIELLESLYNQNINGIVYYPLSASLPVETLNTFAKDGRPVIILDKETSHPGFSNIICDNYRGGHLLAEHLISYGHTKTCYLSRFMPDQISSVSGRYDGYKTCLEAAGLEPRFMHWESDSPTGYYMLQHLVNTLRLDGVTAILCENDEVAFNVHMCCLSLGIHVPKDMNITGFDNIEWATTGSAQITTVDQNFDVIGETIAKTLLEENYKPRNHTTPVQLVPRTSTNAVAKQTAIPSLSLQYALASQ
ncbi:MAG: GntR family transcriptional regulator [Defluviitaleaceae bacterium]|nr:GntR family transcriptional regulator [Defluviitaleaceae bacterium]